LNRFNVTNNSNIDSCEIVDCAKKFLISKTNIIETRDIIRVNTAKPVINNMTQSYKSNTGFILQKKIIPAVTIVDE
jgi:hypothetical protein